MAKAGDTRRDIEEGLNAGCGLTIGVCTGAGTSEGLKVAGADLVLDDITQFGELMLGGFEERFVTPTNRPSVGEPKVKLQMRQ